MYSRLFWASSDLPFSSSHRGLESRILAWGVDSFFVITTHVSGTNGNPILKMAAGINCTAIESRQDRSNPLPVDQKDIPYPTL
jgi:hypothetical protein